MKTRYIVKLKNDGPEFGLHGLRVGLLCSTSSSSNEDFSCTLNSAPVAGDGECELVTVYRQTHYVIPSKKHEFLGYNYRKCGSRSP